jgi:hypothetical protein
MSFHITRGRSSSSAQQTLGRFPGGLIPSSICHWPPQNKGQGPGHSKAGPSGAAVPSLTLTALQNQLATSHRFPHPLHPRVPARDTHLRPCKLLFCTLVFYFQISGLYTVSKSTDIIKNRPKMAWLAWPVGHLK